MNDYYQREITNRVKKINNTFRVLAVTGPRQVGKSTLLKTIMPKDMNYVTLDDEVLRNNAIEDPNLFLKNYKSPLFIDEIQYAPNLFSYIKMNVDNDESRGQYWLSGSQAFELMKGITESLAGRVGLLKMNSFTYREIKKIVNDKLFDPEKLEQKSDISVEELFELIYNGGMPELYKIKDMDRNEYYNSYINTYIEKDVKHIKDIGNMNHFKKFMQEMALRVGTTLNYSDISNEIGVAVNTIKSWTSILESTGIIYLLPGYSSSKIERLTKMPKIIFMDMGLACYLAEWDSARSLQLDQDSGRYLESYIISEIIKQYNNAGIKLTIYHLRSKEKNEIDLLIFKNRTLYPLEIKKTTNPNKSMIKNFEMLAKSGYKVGTGGVICCYDKLLLLDDNNYIIPISSVINP